jgi:type IV pilus assembly protein PilA
MLYRLRQRSADESGFTLIELLVVILIIGILAAIAIPSFINQKGKANDAAAKSQARTGETAAETYATENSGSYASISAAKLQAIEPTLKDTSGAKFKEAVETESGAGYKVVSEAASTGDTFTIERNKEGEITRSCATAGKNGCPTGGKW